jgi:hypothetical protein
MKNWKYFAKSRKFNRVYCPSSPKLAGNQGGDA